MDIENSTISVAGDLSGAGSTIIGYSNEISGELQSLVSQLSPLTSSTDWQGAANDYYNNLQQEWNIAAAGLFGPDGVLGQIANAMNITWNNYSDAEWANVKTWSGGGSGT